MVKKNIKKKKKKGGPHEHSLLELAFSPSAVYF